MMDELPEIECTSCMWQGYMSELTCHPADWEKPADEARYNVCPECGEIDCFDDYED